MSFALEHRKNCKAFALEIHLVFNPIGLPVYSVFGYPRITNFREPAKGRP